MPLYVCVAMYLDGPKWGNGDPLCGVDMPLHIIQKEFLKCGMVGSDGGAAPFAAFPSPCTLFQGSWSDPDITAPKSTCFQVAVALASSPFVIIPIALSIIVDPTMTGTFLE